MTRDEILAMAPGRELDALVAEKVMGWHKMLMTPQNNGWFWSDGNKHAAWDSFSPSTDIAAAWEVVEKAFKEWFDFGIGHCDKPDMWQVYWGFDGYGWRDVEAPSAPEAICKAALLAVLEEIA